MGTPRADGAYQCPFNDDFNSEDAFTLNIDDLLFSTNIEQVSLNSLDSISISNALLGFTTDGPLTLDVTLVVDELGFDFSLDQADVSPDQNFDIVIDDATFNFALDAVIFNQESLFPTYPSQGTVQVALVPTTDTPLNTPTTIYFGCPFPRNTVPTGGLGGIRLLENAVEIPCEITELARWRPLGANPINESIRSVRVAIETTFNSITPKVVEVQWGSNRTLNLVPTLTIDQTYTFANRDPIPDEFPPTFEVDNQDYTIREPITRAILPAQYLQDCRLDLPVESIGANDADPFWNDYDDKYEGYSRTYVNNFTEDPNAPITVEITDYISAEVLGRGDLTGYARWLYDRDTHLWQLYIKTGNIAWAISAHRNTDFYGQNIRTAATGTGEEGSFYLVDSVLPCGFVDAKFMYARGIFIDYMLTGWDRNVDKIDNISNGIWQGNNLIPTTYPVNAVSDAFTEREFYTAIMSQLSAWERSGSQTHADRVIAYFELVIDLQNNPSNYEASWTYTGAMTHAVSDHEYCPGNISGVGSPWMTALLMQSIFKYYMHSADQRALTSLSQFGDFLTNHATYVISDGGQLDGERVPFYLAGDGFGSGVDDSCNANASQATNDSYGAREHAPDVMYACQMAAWAKRQLSEDTTAIEVVINDLKATTTSITSVWINTSNTDAPTYRIRPGRKPAWWFGHGAASWYENN